jgi:hypothetical protein
VDEHIRVPGSVTGLWGEASVVLSLKATGWAVEWDGGMTAGRDLRAGGPRGQLVHVQVKTSTAVDGRISWKKEGEPARAWAANVSKVGAVPLYAFVHFDSPATMEFDLDKRTLTIAIPESYLITATSPAAFADDVDAARIDYGSRLRQRRGRNGEAVGQHLSPDGLQYPVMASGLALNVCRIGQAT